MAPKVALAQIALLVAAVLPRAASAQPTFAVEVEGGRTVGLTPYLQNLVYTGAQIRGDNSASSGRFQPFLADEKSSWGTDIAVRLVSDNLQAGLTAQWFDISSAEVHHRGRARNGSDGRLRATRIRPDGTVDDSGVEYRQLDESIDLSLDPSRRASLFVFGAEVGYRFYLYSGEVDLFAPVVGSALVTYLNRDFAPVRPGLGVKSGISAAFDFVSVMSLVVGGRLEWFATANYWNRSDAARRASELDQSTESALFSSQLSASLSIGLQFAIR